MRLLQEAAYQTKTADTLLDQLSGVWAEVPVEAVRLTRDSLDLRSTVEMMLRKDIP